MSTEQEKQPGKLEALISDINKELDLLYEQFWHTLTKQDVGEMMSGFWGKTSTKIAFAIATMTFSLFFLLHLLVVQNSRLSFIEVINELTINPDSSEFQRLPNAFFSGSNILVFDFDGQRRPIPLQDVFMQTYQASFAWISVAAVGSAFFIGYFATQVFSKPLNQLITGMKSLRRNNYKFKINNTGTKEFDAVIEEFNHLTEELNRVETLRKDLISDTSHELKTPLTGLLGQLEGVRDGIFEMTPERANSLIEQIHRLDNLVDKLQEFSKLRSKNLPIACNEITLHSFASEIVEQYSTQLHEKNIAVELKIEPDLEIQADKNLLTQVFQNLMQNALQYSNASNIIISATPDHIIFHDDGVGIPEEHLPYIFERFYRVEKSRNRKTGGIGLGMAIIQEIIDSHGWEIKAENNAGLKISIAIKKAY